MIQKLLNHLSGDFNELVPGHLKKVHSKTQFNLISQNIESPTLLVHFTDHPFNIIETGLMGVSDCRLLGLTKNQPTPKVLNGYNFAYPAKSKEARYQQQKGESRNSIPYGEFALVFRAPHILVKHKADKDIQAIFCSENLDLSQLFVISRHWNGLKWLLSDYDLNDPEQALLALSKFESLDAKYCPLGIPDNIKEIKDQPSMVWRLLNQSNDRILFSGNYLQVIDAIDAQFKNSVHISNSKRKLKLS